LGIADVLALKCELAIGVENMETTENGLLGFVGFGSEIYNNFSSIAILLAIGGVADLADPGMNKI